MLASFFETTHDCDIVTVKSDSAVLKARTVPLLFTAFTLKVAEISFDIVAVTWHEYTG